jgi:hypothetical protein
MKKLIPLLIIIISIKITMGFNEIYPLESPANSYYQVKKTVAIPDTINHKKTSCFYDQLSDKYYYQVNVLRSGKEDNLSGPDSLIINISDKSDYKLRQTIGIKPGYLFHDSYSNCDAVKSYITNFYKDNDVFEYPYAELIIADFNFDSLEDFAIMVDEGGNTGAGYRYFIQDSSGLFHEDNFLSDEMMYFPVEIDSKNKILKTLVHKDAFGAYEKEYKYDVKKKSWKFIKQTYRGK